MRNTHSIQFLDLQRQYRTIKGRIDSAVKRVIDRQFFILGDELVQFEHEFSKYLKSPYVLGLGSGTDALILSLRALGIGPGDEVLTSVNSYIATTLAITEVGATPVFVDADPDTYEMDITKLKKNLSSKTKAILPVHLYGAPAPIDEIVQWARKHSLYVVEDAAQSSGSTLRKKMTGTFGDIGVFSFYPGKNLGAYGDGGAIATPHKKLFEKLQKLRNYGQTVKYHHDSIGVNSRLDEIQAAILRTKLEYLSAWNKKRNQIAQEYHKGLKVKTQKILPYEVSNYHVFAIEVEHRDKLQEFLKKNGVDTLIHYPVPIHLQKCYAYFGFKKGDFPVAEQLATHILSLPMYAELTTAEVKKIVALVNSFCESSTSSV